MTSLAQRTRHAWPGDARCVVALTLDFDGTLIVTTRSTGTIERVDRTGATRAVIANVSLAEGPSLAPGGDLFFNDTGPTAITYKAAPVGGFGPLTPPCPYSGNKSRNRE